MTVTMADLREGDIALFDPAYGAERITSRTERWVGAPLIRDHAGELLRGPTAEQTSTPWIMLHFGLSSPSGKDGSRYVVRFEHEPVVKLEKAADSA